MLSYLILITQSYMEYEGDAWLGYDHHFRQRAASNPQASWDKSDSTLWNIAFSGKQKPTDATTVLAYPTSHWDANGPQRLLNKNLTH